MGREGPRGAGRGREKKIRRTENVGSKGEGGKEEGEGIGGEERLVERTIRREEGGGVREKERKERVDFIRAGRIFHGLRLVPRPATRIPIVQLQPRSS